MSFSPHQRFAMFFPVIGACFSLVASSFVLFLASLRGLRRMASGRRRTPDATDNIIFVNLMLADFIQALGEAFTLGWLVDGVVSEGYRCNTQAVLKQVGAVGVAFSSTAIAAHTFCVLVFRWSAPKYISKLVVLTIWIFIALIVTIPYVTHGSGKRDLYGDLGFWCWVITDFRTEQLFTEYIWLWGAASIMAILYSIMFAVMRGWFIVENGVWFWHKNYTPRFDAGQPVEETEEEKDSKAIANLLLLYPVPYCFSIIPYSIARWLTFLNLVKVAYQGTLFTTTLFSLSGAFNAILFFLTRPELVVGSADSPPPAQLVDTQILDHKLASTSSRFGSLPSHRPIASDYTAPHLERDPNGQYNPYDSIILAEGTNSNIRASPRWSASDSANYPTYLSGERSYGDFRSNLTVATPVEESYGHLPS